MKKPTELKKSTDEDEKIQAVKESTSFLFHKHYCENDVEAIIELFDDKLSWIGAGENEYDLGTEKFPAFFGSLWVWCPNVISGMKNIM